MFKSYQQYKQSGVEWLGEVPSHWEIGKIKNFAIVNPKIIKRHIADNEDIEFIPMANIDEVKGIVSSISYRKFKEVSSGYTAFNSNDVVFAKITPCMENGNCAVIPNLKFGFGFGTTEFIVFRADSKLHNKFLYFILRNTFLRNICKKFMTGTAGQQRISSSFLASYPIAIPTVSEQTQIATYLDQETQKIDNLILKQEKLIKLLEEQRKSIISHAVTKGIDPNAKMKDSGVEWLGEVPEHWGHVPLKHLSSCNDDVLSENTNENYEIVYVDIGSVSALYGITEKESFYFKDAPSRARRIVKDGDVIISTVRTYLKAIAQIKSPESNLIVSTGFAVVRANKYLNQDFLALSLKADYFQREVALLSTGVSYPAITSANLISIKILLPDLNEQKKIVDFVNQENQKIDKIIQKQTALIEKLKEYRSSIISHAVTGKIDVRHLIS